MKKKPAKDPLPSGPRFPAGSDVLIKRPHLWSGCSGEVVAVSSDGWHRIRILGKEGGYFHTDAQGNDLEATL